MSKIESVHSVRSVLSLHLLCSKLHFGPIDFIIIDSTLSVVVKLIFRVLIVASRLGRSSVYIVN